MRYNLSTQEYHGYVVSDWTIEGKTVTLTVREDQQWHDGTAVTATDVANQIKLDIYNGGSLGQFVAPEDEGTVPDRVVATDERTVELTLVEEANKDIVLPYLQPKYLAAHPGTYGDLVEKFDEAGSQEERSRVLNELTGMAVPDPVGSGPFTFEDADSQRTLVTKFGDHFDADNINFDEAEYLYKPSNQSRWNGLIGEETDGSATLFMPNNKLNQLPDSVQVSLIPRHWGLGIVFNHDRAPVDDVRVRKAVAHVINRKAVAGNSGAGTNSKIPVTYPTGLTSEFSGQVEGTWLEGVTDQFQTYGRDTAQTDEAASLLQDAGYQKQGGTWKKDGEALRIPIKGPAGFSDWVAGAETVVSQLRQFGIESEAAMKDTSTYWGKDYPNANFVAALQGWANYNQTFPYFHQRWLFDSTDANEYWQVPDEMEAPVLHEDYRDGETVEPAQLVSELSTASQ
jgi:peptide/nickel transport system substrate-binding protein